MISQDAISHIEGYRNRQVKEAVGDEPYNLLKKGEILALNAALSIMQVDEPQRLIEFRLDKLRTTMVGLCAYHKAGAKTALGYVKSVVKNVN